jgi:uncharacterized protein YecE (DUF72 family)
MGKIKIGTCGYSYYRPGKGWKERYPSKLQAFADRFGLVEINRTFYQLPMVKTTERWRREVPADFEFALKVWQAITHPTSSMTWRKRDQSLTQRQKKNFGYFGSSTEVRKAWEETRKRAKALEAGVCLFQCPASFDSSKKNENNLRRFFETADRGGLQMAWEPRGDWVENPGRVKGLCDDLNLIHVVDLMRRDPVSDHPTAYVRLHGLNKKEHDYRYDYSRGELQTLAGKLRNLGKDHDVIYCLFNNDAMYVNAQGLMEIISRGGR